MSLSVASDFAILLLCVPELSDNPSKFWHCRGFLFTSFRRFYLLIFSISYANHRAVVANGKVSDTVLPKVVVLHVWNAHNTILGSKCLAICAQAVYFLHSTRPSVTWLNSRWWLAACDWVMSALSAVLSTRVRRCRKFGEVSCTECTYQGDDFESIPTVKMENKNPVEGSLAVNFRRSLITVEWHRPEVARSWKVFAFLEKRPLR